MNISYGPNGLSAQGGQGSLSSTDGVLIFGTWLVFNKKFVEWNTESLLGVSVYGSLQGAGIRQIEQALKEGSYSLVG